MKIGTLSFELQNDKMALSCHERIQIIKTVIQKHCPNFILCAGYSLENNIDLLSLKDVLYASGSDSTLVVEVKNDDQILSNGHPLNNEIPEWNASQHKMFVIRPGKAIIELGPQFFATSNELDTKPQGKILLSTFEAQFVWRTFFIDKFKAVALCCGELNVFKGRDSISCRSELIKKTIFEADIVVNPTHDGMANYGTLNAKRRYLSRKVNGRNRCYISSSNWNTSKSTKRGVISQSPASDSLHSVYLNGEKQVVKRFPDPNGCYELRIAEISI